MKKVSVIIGAYNCEKTVIDSLESIVGQTYTNWEIIICDDCSSDNTYNVIEKKYKDDSRVTLIRNSKNIKLAATLNKCLSLCTGEYIARMDTDDISLPRRFELQVDYLNNHPEVQVVGSLAKIYDGKNFIGIRNRKEYPTKNDVLVGSPFIHPSIMMRKEIYDDLNGYTVSPRTVRGQDRDLWFRFFSRGYVGYNIQIPLIIYHESVDDYKKRTFKSAVGAFKNSFYGFRLLKVPPHKYILTLKPILSFFIPQGLKKTARGEKTSHNSFF